MSKQVNKSFGIRTKFHYGAGLDVHKYHVTACVAVKQGLDIKKLAVQEFKRNPADLETLCRFLGKYLLEIIVMEATGIYTPVVLDELDGFKGWKGIKPDIVVVHPALLKKYPGESHQDKLDALGLARLGLSGLAKGSYIPQDKIRELRSLTRETVFIDRDCARIKTRIKRILSHWGLSLRDLNLSRDWSLDLLRAFQHFQGDFGKTMEEINNGNYPLPKTSRNAIANRYEEYKHFSTIQIPASAILGIKSYLMELSFNGVIIERICGEIESIVGESPILQREIRRIDKLPGITTRTATSLVAEIGNINRFPNRKKFLQYVGCAPTQNQSGETRRKGHLGKRVNHFAKVAFFMAGKAVVENLKQESYLKEYARKQLNAHWGKKKLAYANTGIKLARIVYAIMSKGHDYDPAFESRKADEFPASDESRSKKHPSKYILRTLRKKVRHLARYVKNTFKEEKNEWYSNLSKYFKFMGEDDSTTT